jgi:putative transcriptional regulator
MIQPAAGILLIADPFLKDPSFTRTVVLMCDHNDEGSIGFILNKLYDYTLSELLTDFEDCPLPVYYGGPVQMNTIHFIHQYPDLVPGGKEILKDVYWGGDFEMLKTLIKNNSIDTNKVKFFIGYSGWSEGQLDNELKEKTWLTVSATSDLVYNTPQDQIWKNSLKHLGGEFEIMVNFPLDPQLN